MRAAARAVACEDAHAPRGLPRVVLHTATTFTHALIARFSPVFCLHWTMTGGSAPASVGGDAVSLYRIARDGACACRGELSQGDAQYQYDSGGGRCQCCSRGLPSICQAAAVEGRGLEMLNKCYEHIEQCLKGSK
jgi:hypothetical protein